jgi:hypothetical protein
MIKKKQIDVPSSLVLGLVQTLKTIREVIDVSTLGRSYICNLILNHNERTLFSCFCEDRYTYAPEYVLYNTRYYGSSAWWDIYKAEANGAEEYLTKEKKRFITDVISYLEEQMQKTANQT